MENRPRQITDRFLIYDISGKAADNFKEDVLYGLHKKQKAVPPKYFYDDTGSELFESICETEEYYVTRTETEILLSHSASIAESCSGITNITELGSGSSVKTRYLLEAFLNSSGFLKYMPIDVSDILLESGYVLVKNFKDLSVTGFIGEYEGSLKLVSLLTKEPKLIIFLGSSIGNFDIKHAEDFLRSVSLEMNPNDRLLVGFDLVKSTEILNAAYNDKQGVTARFNLNLLNRINRELDGNFDPLKFEHKAFFNADESRIEMHLVSLEEQDVSISGESFHFAQGETIHTENSYKFTHEMISKIAATAGLNIITKWNDKNNLFGLYMFNIKHP